MYVHVATAICNLSLLQSLSLSLSLFSSLSLSLRMNSALLSRFDLVFILLDNPDEEMDSMLSEHVMALHARHSGHSHQQQGRTARTTQRVCTRSLH